MNMLSVYHMGIKKEYIPFTDSLNMNARIIKINLLKNGSMFKKNFMNHSPNKKGKKEK